MRLNNMTTIQEQRALDEEFKITKFVENEDGSAIIQCEMSEFVKSALVEKGMLTLIKTHIEALEDTEHLK